MLTKRVPATPPDRISLKRRVLSAGAWSLAGYGFGQALRFGSNLIMTRLLVPEMFGVMAIATVVMIGLDMFSDLGLRQSIVQSRRGNDPAFLNTAWSVQIVRGVLLWLVAVFVALLVAIANSVGLVPMDSVYADPKLPYVIGILSFVAVIGGFGSTKAFEVHRNLALARLVPINIAAQVLGLVCMLWWAYLDRSIWALVAGSICGSLSVAILSHLWLPGTTNRLQWDISAFREIFHFGKWIFLSSILGFLVANGDRLLLGGLIDGTLLGLYVVAFQIYSVVEQIFARLTAGVSFPALSEIARERPATLRTNYYRIHSIVSSAAYFCSGMLMISGQSLIGLLYDPRYREAGWMLEVLAVALLTVPFQISIQCYMALGKPRLHSNILAIRLVTLVMALPMGSYFFGLSGALWGLVFSQFLGVPITILYNVRYGLFDFRRELLSLPMVFVGMAAGGILTFIIARYTGN